MYREVGGATKPVEKLDELCARLPIHLVLGLEHDFMYDVPLPFTHTLTNLGLSSPAKVHEILLDRGCGSTFASVTKMQDVGHLVCLICPLCEIMFTVLSDTPGET